jgi:ferric-dicitrate binding protein FerR (iron transport regulator)
MRAKPLELRQRRAAIGIAVLVGVAIALAVGWDSFERSRIHSVELGDGVLARVLGRSQLEPSAGSEHKLWLDGEAVIDTSATAALTLRSTLLEVVLEGGEPARFYIDAHAKQPGAQVLVLRGHLRVDKAYASPRPESHRLGPGEMLMVNRDIDFVENEKFTPAELPDWVRGDYSAR